MPLARRTMPLVVPNNAACVPNNAASVPNNAACVSNNAACVPNNVACVPNHCAQRRKCTRPTPSLPVRSPRGSLSTAAPLPAYGRSAVRRVGEGEGKGGRPLVQCRIMPLVVPNNAAGVPNHCAQRWKCTRPTPPLPVRSPRGNLSTAAPPPADGRSAERRVGGGRRQRRTPPCTATRPCPCALPAAAGLPPRPRRLNGCPGSAGGRENDRMAHRRTTTPTHQTPRGNDTCTIRVPRRKGAQSVVHNL